MPEYYHEEAAGHAGIGGDAYKNNDDPFDNYSHEPEYDVGVSDKTILIISVIGFGVMTLVVYVLIVSRSKSADELDGDHDGGRGGADGIDTYEEELLRADVATLNRAQRRLRAKALMKRQRRAPTNDGLMVGAANHNIERNNNDDTGRNSQTILNCINGIK